MKFAPILKQNIGVGVTGETILSFSPQGVV